MITDRATIVAKVVQVAIATTPSIAVARKTLATWSGHPADRQLKPDALAMLDQLEAEAKQP